MNIKRFVLFRSPQAILVDWFVRKNLKRGGRVSIQHSRQNFLKIDSRWPETPGFQKKLVASVECDFFPGKVPGRTLLWLHGGGFAVRFPRTHALLATRVNKTFGAEIIIPDYSLAPEFPYPKASDECLAVYQELLKTSHDIVLAGDSAGGNLSLGLIHRLKAEGLPLPKCVILLSPATDLTMNSPSLIENQQADVMFTPEILKGLLAVYCPMEKRQEVFASPLLGDLHGFPPLLFQVGSTEMLRDESLRFAEKAHQAKVIVEVQIWQKMLHVFQAIWFLPEASWAIREIQKFIKKQTGWDSAHE